MARRYIRDSKGRFAGGGGGGGGGGKSGGKRPNRIRSQFAANTRLAGAYERAIKKNQDWELRDKKLLNSLPVRGVAPTKNRMRTAVRMSNLYSGNVGDLRQDLHNMTAMAKDYKQTQRQLRRQLKWSKIF